MAKRAAATSRTIRNAPQKPDVKAESPRQPAPDGATPLCRPVLCAAMDARGRLRRSPEGPTVYDGEKLKGLDELFSSVRLRA